MASEDHNSRPLQKLGEWDVNDPASTEGFTVIFSKAWDEKVAIGAAGNGVSVEIINGHYQQSNTCKKPKKR
jgi:hypothetical protein